MTNAVYQVARSVESLGAAIAVSNIPPNIPQVFLRRGQADQFVIVHLEGESPYLTLPRSDFPSGFYTVGDSILGTQALHLRNNGKACNFIVERESAE